jgi:hypothetical protein
MATIQAEFDGRVFVPRQAVDLPVGTKVAVIVPDPPRAPTEEENRIWEYIQRQLDATEPYFPTVEEAMRYLRKRP